MISSELPEVLGMSDRIYIMNEGKIVGEVDGKEATQGNDHVTYFEIKQRRIIMENKIRISEVLKKYTMVIVLVAVVILFTVNTGGKMLLPPERQ